MNTEDKFAESFQKKTGKTNILESSYNGWWEIYRF